MTDPSLPPIRMWLAAPLSHEVTEALGRLQRAPDIQRIAVMPDVHLANDICVGVVLATSRLIYPQAVGGDIGCGMLGVATNSRQSRCAIQKPPARFWRDSQRRSQAGVATGRLLLPSLKT